MFFKKFMRRPGRIRLCSVFFPGGLIDEEVSERPSAEETACAQFLIITTHVRILHLFNMNEI